MKNMATATFDKTFIIDNPESQKKLLNIISSDKRDKVFSKRRTVEDKERSALALKLLLSH